MNGTDNVYVTLEPRFTKTKLFSAVDLRTALQGARKRSPRSSSRFAIWTEPSTPEQDHDIVVCASVPLFESRRSQAEEVVARWDATWLLIESMGHRHRESARQHLVDVVSMALLASAVEGVGEPADKRDDDDF